MNERQKYIVYDTNGEYYCSVHFRSELKEKEFSKIINNIFIELLDCEEDFSTKFEKEIRSKKEFHYVKFDYNELIEKEKI